MTAIIPDDLAAFLREGKRLAYDPDACEAGQIELLALADLAPGEVWIDARPKDDPQGDPHAGEQGYYTVPAVNLVSEADGYDPEFILLWLPDEGLYGTWDCDHWDLFVFPGVSWSDLVADPAPYIDAQWRAEDCCEVFVPYPRHPFRPGRPF